MEILFLGVGEACDPQKPNTSLYVRTAQGHRFLLDCGFTTPHIFFSFVEDPDELDVVWISHFHGDHFFGMPLLLLRFWEMERKKPLIITGQKGVREKITAVMDLAYPDFLPRLQFRLHFIEIEPGQENMICESSWQTAENVHSTRALSLLINDGEHRFFYSGDGRPTPETQILADGCDLMVHEAFRLDKEVRNHGNILSSLDFARKARVKKLALVHLERNCRKNNKKAILDAIQKSGLHVILPKTSETISL
ncbi:MAG: MBL fold metallo-hydrolase [Desulfobulbaceae bacterium]|nr:MBL fold metallo-hydrolase [Desulfobulbaceae bacterium]